MQWGGNEFVGLLVTVAALWHVAGFAFGLVYVHFSLKSLLGIIPYEQRWTPIIKTADLHLWLSGFALIALGILQKGAEEYLLNPKLWCKITVVVIWMLSTQFMRYIGIHHLKNGNVKPMLHLSAINLSCWIYGAFLGCAKPLSYGVVSYLVFLMGFVGMLSFSFVGLYFLRKYKCCA